MPPKVVTAGLIKIKGFFNSVINIDSVRYGIWLHFISLAVLYNIIIIPLRASFVEVTQSNVALWMSLDYVFADLIYLIDIYIRMETSYFDLQGILVLDPKDTRMRYIKSNQFILDLISIFPTDFIYLRIGYLYTIVRINRLLRYRRLLEEINRVEMTSIFSYFFRFFNTVLGILLAIHYVAVFYYSYSKAIGFSPKTNNETVEEQDCYIVESGELSEFQMAIWRSEQSFVKKYAYCYYWATMTLCFIGEMPCAKLIHQKLIQVTLWISGLLVICITLPYSFVTTYFIQMFGTIVGRIGNILNSMTATSDLHQMEMKSIRDYLNFHKIPKIMLTKILAWLNHAYTFRVIGNEEDVLEPLPDKTRSEIAADLHLKTLKSIKLFSGFDESVLLNLVTSLHLQVIAPGDYVCRKGDIGREMYIVRNGMLEVVSDDGQKVFATLGTGTVFGEISLINVPGSRTGNRRTASIRSKGYSDLFILSKNDLYTALTDQPEALTELVDKATEILRKEKKLDENLMFLKQQQNEAFELRYKQFAAKVDEIETAYLRLMLSIQSSREHTIERLDHIESIIEAEGYLDKPQVPSSS